MNRVISQSLWAMSLLVSGAIGAAGTDGKASLSFGEALRQASGRTGVEFVVAPCVAHDRFLRVVPSALTAASTAELLEGYNYWSIASGDGRILRVVVSGRVDTPATGCEDASVSSSEGDDSRPWVHGSMLLFNYEPMPATMPDRYREMPPGAVSPITLPIDELNRMELGERLSMSLPDGQYDVVLENRFEHDNGDVTWVGYLDGLDSGDRVIVTGGAGGSVGQVVTPGATYSIEFEAGRSWLVDTASWELQAAAEQFDSAL